MVLFLAQNPKTEENLRYPLKGTRSGKTFEAWLAILGGPDGKIMNASQKIGKVTWKDYNDEEEMRRAIDQYDFTKFVALGDYASGLFERLGIRHFKLPHPSGLSRKLNDKQEIVRQLNLCRLYIGRK
jgi:hypothetical protein